ncbi:hypothetical protein HPB48_013902 [Haemaphysalis longicornis]|uniref:Uncharacterized protein n=1 Tax=Haemaphysalis longicornis TaxID=44386 RepID=A0A9J6G5C8_HAELO|nr:hypothetical protein HPB48_013902 [Haemaphysalis longicornis]
MNNTGPVILAPLPLPHAEISPAPVARTLPLQHTRLDCILVSWRELPKTDTTRTAMRALLTLAAFIACAAWPAASQDSSTEAPDVATDEPPPPAVGTTPPPPPGINPNHSYYPPSYRPHFNGYNPNSYWNRYPSHGYYPSRPWSYRPPAYHPPPTTYEWWKQFNRRPSFEHGGWSGVGGGYDSSPSPNGYGYWQPYYVAVGYYRRSSYAPSPPIASRGSDSYGAAYPYIMGYDKFGYPYYRSSNYGGGLYGSSIGYVQATTEVTPRLTQGLILILTQAIMATVQVVTEVPPHLIKGVIPILIKAATRPQAVATESTRIMPVMEATPTLGATLITEVILTMEAPTGASHNTQAGIRITEMATVAITDTVGAK